MTVGVLERLEDSIKVMEKALPKSLAGFSGFYQKQKQSEYLLKKKHTETSALFISRVHLWFDNDAITADFFSSVLRSCP